MFFKQSGFKPRSGSTSQPAADSPTEQAAQAQAAASSPPKESVMSAAIAGRRRSSATEKFAGLNAHKRPSTDLSSAERKANYADQSTAGQGVLGQMWNNFTKGS